MRAVAVLLTTSFCASMMNLYTVLDDINNVLLCLAAIAICIVWLSSIKYELVEFHFSSFALVIASAFFFLMIVFAWSVPPFDIPDFFKLSLTCAPLVPLTSVYLLRGNETFLILGPWMGVIILSFFTSLNETMTVTLHVDTHFVYLGSAMINQIYPLVIVFLFRYEARTYHKLLLKHLKLTESKSQAKSTFISRMSHELRTPLHGLLSSASLLKQTPVSEEQSAYLSAIDSCGTSLIDIVMQILSIVRIESGKFESKLEHISLFKLVQEIADSLSDFAHQKKIELMIFFLLDPTGYDVIGDQIHLREILINLIGNALKFTEEGRVLISVFHRESKKKHIYRFEIEDTGIGIPSNMLSHIFEPFCQANINLKKNDGKLFS